VACRAAAAAEAGLVEVARQVGVAHQALMGAGQPSPGQRRYPVHARQLPPGTGDALVAAAGGGGRAGGEAIRDHSKASLDVASPQGPHRLGLRTGNRDHAGAVEAPLPLLHADDDERLPAFLPPTAQPRLLATDAGPADLDPPVETVAARAYADRAQPVQHRPGGPVGADLQRLRQAHRAPAALGWRTSSRRKTTPSPGCGSGRGRYPRSPRSGRRTQHT
jgi:hypothetical protein